MDCPECDRLLRASSFATLEIASAILARELEPGDSEVVKEAEATIAILEQSRSMARQSLKEHLATHREVNLCS
jgi:hypothetical protein